MWRPRRVVELGLRIQKVEDETSKLPEMVAAEVSRQLQERESSGAPQRATGGRQTFAPTLLMVRGWARYGEG